MTAEQFAELRAHAAKVADEAPPVTEEQRTRLAALLRPAVLAIKARATSRPERQRPAA